jgi:DNA excision repair protein ERCC-2
VSAAPQARGELALSVRGLAEMVWRRGDIHARYDVNTRPEEGIAVQRRLQTDRSAGYCREVVVSHRWQTAEHSFLLSGRVDGCDLDADVPLIEEFKTTRIDPKELHACAGSVHLAQVKLYAAMLCEEHPAPFWDVRVIYAHPDTLATHVVAEHLSRDALQEFRDETCRALTARAAELHAHRCARNERLRVASFPYPAFREPQRVLARNVFRAVRDGAGLLAVAPTGTGKTMGTLFPALKAMADGHVDRIVYTTARGTGQRAALDAVARLRASGPLRAVTITAKERACLKDRPLCDPAVCEFARGYYERAPAALAELAAIEEASPASIEEVARRHVVCPFELSLDMSVVADVVICDYNYVFDPVVRLKRMHGFLGDRTAVLIDEAHQLAPRVRRGLSCRIARSTVRRARGELELAALERKRTAFDRSFAALRKAVLEGAPHTQTLEVEIDKPVRLLAAARRFLDAWLEVPRTEPATPDAETLLFDVLRLLRGADWSEAAGFVWVLRQHARDIVLDLECLDPSAHIADTLATFRANVRFSATLAPLALAQRQHGDTDGCTVDVPSPFPSEHLAVLIVPDVRVRYRERVAGLDGLIDTIETVTNAKPGAYLVALPSFEYLGMVRDRMLERGVAGALISQRPNMGARERAAFVERLANPGGPLVACVVLGGVFAESIDLDGGALIGIIVVGVGLAPRTGELDRIQREFCDDGYDVAYRQPAMTRVVQAAGRLIRGEEDRGVLCLVDPRYRDEAFGRYLPSHWTPEVVRASNLGDRLSEFWSAR